MGYDYNSWEPVGISPEDLDDNETHLLRDSESFCIYPWIHLHTYPTGETYPCCHADMNLSVGSTKKHSLRGLWNSDTMVDLRKNMLCDKKSKICEGCYEQEEHGFFSGRNSANKHHGHHIGLIKDTEPNGYKSKMKLTYWDIRFSNLCNLSCRSCGHIFSSSWYKDQAVLAGPTWAKENKALNIAGPNNAPNYLVHELLTHIDEVEQIYFAGGEPLMMEQHYAILDELIKHKKFNVRLIYNTNFTVTKLKDKSVFEYWKLFDSVSVGASLDGMGKRAEYIREGTDWEVVCENRKRMMKECPNADFYISATLSIMNALHLPDFHKLWVEAGFIEPQDFNINILQDPQHYRIDIAPKEYKDQITAKFNDHIKWLKDKDPLNRASTGYESALNFLWATNNSHLVETFWEKTNQLDDIRGQHCLDNIPELKRCVVV